MKQPRIVLYLDINYVSISHWNIVLNYALYRIDLRHCTIVTLHMWSIYTHDFSPMYAHMRNYMNESHVEILMFKHKLLDWLFTCVWSHDHVKLHASLFVQSDFQSLGLMYPIKLIWYAYLSCTCNSNMLTQSFMYGNCSMLNTFVN